MKTRILAMNPAKWLQTLWLLSTTKLTLFHSILLTRFIRFALASLKMRLASLGAGDWKILVAARSGPGPEADWRVRDEAPEERVCQAKVSQ